jgi:ABC-type transport system involved in cytochrome bd biosynthesis fused ATPase/permease subunit
LNSKTSWKEDNLEIATTQTNSLKLPQEPPAIVESNRVPAYWPSSSNNDSLITVEDLEIRYAPDLLAVLQNISFTSEAGERVGLLGRIA